MLKLRLDKGVDLPELGSKQASGFDVRATKVITSYKCSKEIEEVKLKRMQIGFNERNYIKIRPFERVLFGTGLYVSDMSEDIELQVRSRSGTALKKGVFVANQPGTIDSDYRGEIGVILYNSSPNLVRIDKNERVAQIVPKNKIKIEILESSETVETERGTGGFGSSGSL